MFTSKPSEYSCEGDTMGTPSPSRRSEQTKRATTVPLCSLLSQSRVDNLPMWMHVAARALIFECVGCLARLSLNTDAREGAKVFTNV